MDPQNSPTILSGPPVTPRTSPVSAWKSELGQIVMEPGWTEIVGKNMCTPSVRDRNIEYRRIEYNRVGGNLQVRHRGAGHLHQGHAVQSVDQKQLQLNWQNNPLFISE